LLPRCGATRGASEMTPSFAHGAFAWPGASSDRNSGRSTRSTCPRSKENNVSRATWRGPTPPLRIVISSEKKEVELCAFQSPYSRHNAIAIGPIARTPNPLHSLLTPPPCSTRLDKPFRHIQKSWNGRKSPASFAPCFPMKLSHNPIPNWICRRGLA